MHRRRELESLEIHRRIARLLEEDPVRVIGKARGNLRSWLAQRGEDALCSTFREWEDLLDSLGVAELSRLLVAGDEKSVRLRQSSPFAGVFRRGKSGRSNGEIAMQRHELEHLIRAAGALYSEARPLGTPIREWMIWLKM